MVFGVWGAWGGIGLDLCAPNKMKTARPAIKLLSGQKSKEQENPNKKNAPNGAFFIIQTFPAEYYTLYKNHRKIPKKLELLGFL